MGAAESSEIEGDKSSLAAEILKLKAAKSSGWLSEEEFDTEVKRLIREYNGEAREPAYAFDRVMDAMSDAEQMAQWEERYGAGVSDAVQTLDGEQAELLAGRSESGVVELDLTGGAATGSPSKQLLVELQAASITDLSQDVADMQPPPAAAAAQAAAPEAAEVSGHGTVGLLSDVVGGVAELSLDAGDEEGAGDAGDDGAVVEGEAGEDVGDTGKKKKKKNKGKASKDLVVQASVERQGGKGGGGGECEEAEEDDGDRLQEVPVTPKAQQVPSSDDMVDLLTDE